MDKIKSYFSDASTSDTAQIVGDSLGVQSEESKALCTSLDWSTRIQGFLFTFGIGAILSIGGTVNLWTGNVTAFAILYSMGTIVSLMSSMFLRGPVAQFKAMIDPTRAVATAAMLLFVFLTIRVWFFWGKFFFRQKNFF